jgi:hypothetical protein
LLCHPSCSTLPSLLLHALCHLNATGRRCVIMLIIHISNPVLGSPCCNPWRPQGLAMYIT